MLTLAQKFVLDTCIDLMDWVTKPPDVTDLRFDIYKLDGGICPNIIYKFRVLTPENGALFFNLSRLEIKKTLQQLCEDWPKFSGNRLFPVPIPDDFIEKYRHYSDPPNAIYFQEGDLYAGSYGELRLELLQFIIDTLKKEDHDHSYNPA